jgi:hypothetical protein
MHHFSSFRDLLSVLIQASRIATAYAPRTELYKTKSSFILVTRRSISLVVMTFPLHGKGRDFDHRIDLVHLRLSAFIFFSRDGDTGRV